MRWTECPCTRTCSPREINKVTTVKNKHYPTNVKNKFTPAKKVKLCQLKNPEKTPGSEPSGRKTNKSSATVAELTSAVTVISAAESAISELTTAVTAKQAGAEEGGTKDDDSKEENDSTWGSNQGNPALAGCQEQVPKKQKN
jgi:hypothetical protein